MKCSICGKEFEGYGNNPDPVRTDEDARCCDKCNGDYVIPARIMLLGADGETYTRLSNKLNDCSFEELKEIFG